MGSQRKDAAPQSESDTPDAHLWAMLRSGDSERARNALVERHLELVRRVAAKLFAARPDGVADFEDYMHYGCIGLIEALDRYQPDRGAAFSTYASYRIRGAILNGVSKVSERREFHAHRSRLRAERLRSLRTSRETPAADAFGDMVDLTIELALGAMLEPGPERERTADRGGATPYASYALKQAREDLAQLLGGLSEREQLVLRYHYYEHIPFADIARLLGVTKGRISQLHGQALRRLRVHFDGSRSLDTLY